jgi:hypothetical protein
VTALLAALLAHSLHSHMTQHWPGCPRHVHMSIPYLLYPVRDLPIPGLLDGYEMKRGLLCYPQSEFELSIVAKSYGEVTSSVNATRSLGGPAKGSPATYRSFHSGFPIVPLSVHIEVVKSRACLIRSRPRR